MSFNKNLFMPGDYSPGTKVAADERRCEFDIKNDQIVTAGNPVDIVLIGDSITHFFEENYYLSKYGKVINRGIGGDEAHYVAWRFKADAVQLKPRLCVSLVGINNTWTLDETLGETGEYDAAATDRVIKLICSSYASMADEAANAGFTLFICSVLPVGSEIPNYIVRNRMIAKINDALRALAAEKGMKYVDYFSAVFDTGEQALRAGISREGCHPNGEGYTVMMSVLTPLLDEFFGA